ncbi:MAG: hypothetical protein F6J93_36575 [Oscillatoria sp. SIO1A7]|nr:hypothetical protein [Oscillatoria sp. SIO1A7]
MRGRSHYLQNYLQKLGLLALGTSLLYIGLISKRIPAVSAPLLLAQIPPDSSRPDSSPPDSSPLPSPQASAEANPESNPDALDLDLDPEVIEDSPVLQRWLREVPNVLEEIRNDPSFRTRVRFGFSQFPSTDDASGFNLGVEDIFVGKTSLTVSGDYYASGNGDRSSGGAELRYYLLPLGNYVNFAPVLGYRQLETDSYSINGLQVGGRLMVVLSRGGAADFSLTYKQVGIGSDESAGVAAFSVGYALTRNIRLSADLERQDADGDGDNRVGIVLEWMPN